MRLLIFKISEKAHWGDGMIVVAAENFDDAIDVLKNITDKDMHQDGDENSRFFEGDDMSVYKSEEEVPEKGEDCWVLHTVIDNLHWCDEPKSGMNHRHLQCVHRSKRGFIAGVYYEV